MPVRVIPEQRAQALVKTHKTPAALAAALAREGYTNVSNKACSFWMKRRGYGRQPKARYVDLIPWTLRPEHRDLYPAKMLRRLGRERSGATLTEAQAEELARWVRKVKTAKAVVHYDPETPKGFHYVKREETDTDLVRVPPRAA